MVDPSEATVVQTLGQPMTDIETVKDHAMAVRALVSWDRVGVLMDEGPKAIVVVLLDGDNVVSVLRFCLSAAESVDALLTYNDGLVAPMELRCWQGQEITAEQATNSGGLTAAWRESRDQCELMTEATWWTFFEDVEKSALRKGRGTAIRASTQNQVFLDAHGRCMFEGCGADLTIDPNTGVRGNFSTLAHNVAVAESGPVECCTFLAA